MAGAGGSLRRGALEQLRDRDGALLSELAAGAGLSVSGMRKHLRVLEEAGLVRAERVWRERRHWLRTAPMLDPHAWLRGFMERPSETGGLRGAGGSPGEPDGTFVLVSHIRCSAYDVWEALTTDRLTRRWLFGMEVMSIWIPETGVEYRGVGGTLLVRGVVQECEPLRLLSMTWEVLAGAEAGSAPSRVSFHIDEQRGRCRLMLIHEPLGEAAEYSPALEGWRVVLDSLKSLLETGTSLSEVLRKRRPGWWRGAWREP